MSSAPDTGTAQGPGPAREVVRLLARAVRALRTYPVENQMSQQALDRLEQALAAAHALPLEIRAEQICCDGEPLLDSEGTGTDLAENLYRDGVRRVDIASGMERDELQRFVVALATPIHPQEMSEDYVTRLWEADLPHVRVAALDPYLDLQLPDDVLEGHEKPSEELEELAPGADLKIPPAPEEAFAIPRESHGELLREIEETMSSPPWENFIAAVFDVLERAGSQERIVELVSLVEQAFQRVLSDGRLEFAVAILKRFRGRLPAPAVPELRRALTRMVDAERLGPLHRALERGGCRPEDAESVFLMLGPRVVDGVCALLVEASSERTARFYGDVLVKLGKSSVEPVLEHFRSSKGSVRLHFVRILGRLRAPRAVRVLLEELESKDTSLRRDVIRALAMIPDDRAREHLLRIALEDVDPQARAVALRGLGSAQAELDPKRLLARIRSRAFGTLERDEKDLLFLALGRVGGDEAFGFLRKCLQPRWFSRKTTRENWRRAAEAMARSGRPEGRHVLEELVSRGHSELSPICREALQHATSEEA